MEVVCMWLLPCGVEWWCEVVGSGGVFGRWWLPCGVKWCGAVVVVVVVLVLVLEVVVVVGWLVSGCCRVVRSGREWS